MVPRRSTAPHSMKVKRLGLALLLVLLAAACSGADDHLRVIVLGLDGVDPDVVDLLIAEGKLPNFERLKLQGAYARLYSAPPLLSPIIWTTIATGRKPSDHGIGHFITVDPNTGEELPVTSEMRRVAALWNVFSDRDRRVDVVGWWATWPAERVNGTLVSDHAAYHFLMGQKLEQPGSREGVMYPSQAMDELGRFLRRPEEVSAEELAPFVHIDPAELDRSFDFDNDLSHFRWALGAAKTHRDIGLHLWNAESPDLLMVYVEAVDTTSHLFGHLFRQHDLAGELAEQQRHYGDAVEQMYVFADGVVGDFLAAMDERTALVVVSDHGFKLGELPDDPSRTRDMRRVSEAYHRSEGILFLYGAGVRPGVRIERATTLDVAPSVLTLAGLPVADELAGRVLDEVVEPVATHVASYGARDSDAQGAVHDAEVDPQMLEKLRALGYIDAGGSAGDEPRSSTNERNLANILLREHRYEEAAASFRRMSEAEPDNAVLHAALATALIGLGDYDQALAHFDRALELDPLLVAAYHNRGRLHEVRGDVDAAIEDYRRALRYRADYAPARRALQRLGVGLVGRVAETDEERRSAELLQEASARIKRGDYDGAETLVERALELTPDAAVVYQYEANVAVLKGDRERAERALERALELEPDNALFRENLRRLRRDEN